MANLAASIEKSNVDRQAAISQFNAGLETDISKYNSQLNFSQQQFNAQNALVIEQSNVDWRRRMNEIDTAGVNAVNQANAMNLFNLSNQALSMLWQEERDKSNWVWTSSENALDRANRITIAVMGTEAAVAKMDQDQLLAIGRFGIDLFEIATR